MSDNAEVEHTVEKVQLDLRSFFSDASWEPLSAYVNKASKAYPNRLYHNDGKKLGAIVVFRNDNDNSWALNKAAVDYVLDAVSAGRIAGGYAILAAGNPETVASSMEIGEVAKLLNDVPPIRGNFGPYWWVNKQFMTGQSAALADAPF